MWRFFRSEAGTSGYASEVLCLLAGLAAAQCLFGGSGEPFRPVMLAAGLGMGAALGLAVRLGCSVRKRRRRQ